MKVEKTTTLNLIQSISIDTNKLSFLWGTRTHNMTLNRHIKNDTSTNFCCCFFCLFLDVLLSKIYAIKVWRMAEGALKRYFAIFRSPILSRHDLFYRWQQWKSMKIQPWGYKKVYFPFLLSLFVSLALYFVCVYSICLRVVLVLVLWSLPLCIHLSTFITEVFKEG